MLPRDERISWKEAEQVVRLHRLRRDYPIDVPLSELADALNIDVAEVNHLVADARQSVRPRRRFTDRSGLLSAGIAAAAAVLLLLAFAGVHVAHRATSAAAAPDKVMVVEASGAGYGIGDRPVNLAPPSPESAVAAPPPSTASTITVDDASPSSG